MELFYNAPRELQSIPDLQRLTRLWQELELSTDPPEADWQAHALDVLTACRQLRGCHVDPLHQARILEEITDTLFERNVLVTSRYRILWGGNLE